MISPSVPQRETPGSLLAHPHPHPHFISSAPTRVPAPALAAPVGSIAAPLPGYAASYDSYDHFESRDLGFADMELDSATRLLNALPPPIRRHQAQSYTFGAGVVRWTGCFYSDSISAMNYACTLRVLLCPLSDVCVRSCSTSLVPPTQTCTPHHCPWNPVRMPRFLTLGISTWEHNNRYSLLCDKHSECSRRSRGLHTRVI